MKEDLLESEMKNISIAKIERIGKIKESIEILTQEIKELINFKLILKEKRNELIDKRTKLVIDFGDNLSSNVTSKNIIETDKEIRKVGKQINKVDLKLWGDRNGKMWKREKHIYRLKKVIIGNAQKGKVFENYYSDYIDELNKKLQNHIESILDLFNISVPSEDLMLDLMLKVQKMKTSDVYEAIEVGADKFELEKENILKVLRDEKIINENSFKKFIEDKKLSQGSNSVEKNLKKFILEANIDPVEIHKIDSKKESDDDFDKREIIDTINNNQDIIKRNGIRKYLGENKIDLLNENIKKLAKVYVAYTYPDLHKTKIKKQVESVRRELMGMKNGSIKM